MDKNNQEGMTLVELLAAITILGILFVGFMAVFPQMTNFNEKTEEKLETMNLARVELATIKQNGLGTLYQKDSSPDDTSRPGIAIFEYEEQDYQYEVDYSLIEEDLGGDDDQEQAIKLNQIHIKVKKDDRIISETFGYLVRE